MGDITLLLEVPVVCPIPLRLAWMHWRRYIMSIVPSIGHRGRERGHFTMKVAWLAGSNNSSIWASHTYTQILS